MSTAFLKLMHLADSAFPIGATSHSFGIETLAAEGTLRAAELEPFLCDLLWEGGRLEATFCRLAYRLATNAQQGFGDGNPTENFIDDDDQFQILIHMLLPHWWALNQIIAAIKGARESRTASATLGRRYLQTVAMLERSRLLQEIYQQSIEAAAEIHYCVTFGFVGGQLALGEEECTLAYLQQNTMGLLSASLRLLSIGQSRAGEILWRLKDVMGAVAEASANTLASLPPAATTVDWMAAIDELSLFTPVVDLGSMRHPTLRTRLFIS